MKVDIYFFTGTGNSLLIASSLKAELLKQKVSVSLIPIEKADPRNINKKNIIGIVFPCAVHLTYPFVIKFLNSIKYEKSLKIFVIVTMAGTKSGFETYMVNLQNKHGFQLLRIEDFRMPNNFFPSYIDENQNSQRIIESQLRVAQFALEILKPSNGKINKKDWMSRLFNPLATTKWMWWVLRRLYRLEIDRYKCQLCKKCVDTCPVGNLTYEEDKIAFGDNCQLCMRCITLCPQNAINLKNKRKKYKLYKISNISSDYLRNSLKSPFL